MWCRWWLELTRISRTSIGRLFGSAMYSHGRRSLCGSTTYGVRWTRIVRACATVPAITSTTARSIRIRAPGTTSPMRAPNPRLTARARLHYARDVRSILLVVALLALPLAAGAAPRDVFDRVAHRYADNDGVHIHYATLGHGP